MCKPCPTADLRVQTEGSAMRWIRRGFFTLTVGLAVMLAGCSTGNDTGNPATGIGPEGGTVESGDGRVVLTVPKGALSSRVDIRIQTGSGFAKSFVPITNFYSFDPDGLKFSSPVTVKFAYDPAGLPKSADEGALRVF